MVYDYFRVTSAQDTVIYSLSGRSLASLKQSLKHHQLSPNNYTRQHVYLRTMSKIPSDDILESLYKLRIRESDQLNTIGIVRHGDSSEDINAPLSKVENHGKKEHRSETSIAKLWRQAWEAWDRSSGQESKGNEWRWRRKKYLLPVARKRPVYSNGDQCSFRHESNDRAQKPNHTAATPSEPSLSRGRSVSRKRSIRGKSNHGAILRQPCHYYLKGSCTWSLCEYWHPPECQFN